MRSEKEKSAGSNNDHHGSPSEQTSKEPLRTHPRTHAPSRVSRLTSHTQRALLLILILFLVSLLHTHPSSCSSPCFLSSFWPVSSDPTSHTPHTYTIVSSRIVSSLQPVRHRHRHHSPPSSSSSSFVPPPVAHSPNNPLPASLPPSPPRSPSLPLSSFPVFFRFLCLFLPRSLSFGRSVGSRARSFLPFLSCSRVVLVLVACALFPPFFPPLSFRLSLSALYTLPLCPLCLALSLARSPDFLFSPLPFPCPRVLPPPPPDPSSAAAASPLCPPPPSFPTQTQKGGFLFKSQLS